jgi:hypothetical protein
MLTVELKNGNCKAYSDLTEALFNFSGPAELHEKLSTLLETYIQHTHDSNLDISNMAALVNRLNGFFFNLNQLQKTQPGGLTALIDGDKNQCSHN